MAKAPSSRISWRKAEKAVNAVFERLEFALWCGETVDVPGGTLQAKIRKGKPRRALQHFRNIQKRKIEVRVVDYPGRRRVLKFIPDLDLDLTPLPPPPLPETAEQLEARQLASELLGKPANKAIMATLQQAVEVHPFQPGALVRRLRQFKVRGWQFIGDLDWLAYHVSYWHWL